MPVGKPVRFLLRSNDVIHSFWVPNLAGKRDLKPELDPTAGHGFGLAMKGLPKYTSRGGTLFVFGLP